MVKAWGSMSTSTCRIEKEDLKIGLSNKHELIHNATVKQEINEQHECIEVACAKFVPANNLSFSLSID